MLADRLKRCDENAKAALQIARGELLRGAKKRGIELESKGFSKELAEERSKLISSPGHSSIERQLLREITDDLLDSVSNDSEMVKKTVEKACNVSFHLLLTFMALQTI